MFKLLLASLAASFLPVVVSRASNIETNWYSELIRPDFSPPSIVFAIVWPILYILMGLSLFYFLKSDAEFAEKKPGITLFILQLLLNASYMPVFFGNQSLEGGLTVCVALTITIALTIISFYKVSKAAAYLLIPYICWVSFATYLSFMLWQLN